jgi:hypothetical protein
MEQQISVPKIVASASSVKIALSSGYKQPFAQNAQPAF